MKIGITGTHSSGKTTLLNTLRSERCFKDYVFCDEVTRWVKNFNLDINENGSDKTQELIMMKHVYNLYMYDKFITDRTVIDGYVYSSWLFRNNKISKNSLDMVQQVFKRCVNQYDHLFYIKPEFDVVVDGVRSVDPVFREEISQLFEDVLFEKDIKVVTLTGSVRERLDQVLFTLEER